MGVQIYVLDRRQVTLQIEGGRQKIGTLRQSWKVTEIDNERAARIMADEDALAGSASPPAVMIADVAELPLAADPASPVKTHLVIGWDDGRTSVTDFGWDYLPVLGYAIWRAKSAAYVLHQEIDGLLYPMSKAHAVDLGILDDAGIFKCQGQPSIIECRSVRPYITTYAQSDCVFDDGRKVEILTAIDSGNIPPPAWYIGKKPADVARYPTKNRSI